jgi:succinoglycan biosynthesis transport protein ExoP
VRPKMFMNLLMGAAAGLMLGVGLALFIEYLDTSVKTMDDIEKFLNLPVLAVVPKGIRMLTGVSEDSPDAEAYRLLSTNIEFRWEKGGAGARTISIVSGTAGEGKSTTACNLGITIAAAGQRILIVDADMRRPTQHKLLECEGRVGLGDYLSGEAELHAAIHSTSIANLYILPGVAKSARVIGLLKSTRMLDLIDTVKREFDVVLFDCTPIFGVSDASVVTNLVDACVLVVQHRRLPRTMLLRVKSTIDSLKATVLGVVLNNVDVRHDNQYQFYTSSRDYAGKEASGSRTKPNPEIKTRQSSNGKAKSPKRSSAGDDEY